MIEQFDNIWRRETKIIGHLSSIDYFCRIEFSETVRVRYWTKIVEIRLKFVSNYHRWRNSVQRCQLLIVVHRWIEKMFCVIETSRGTGQIDGIRQSHIRS